MARRWTHWDLITSAHAAGTRSNYKRTWPHGYRLAVKHGLLDALFPESANKLGKAIELAKQLNNPVEFRRTHPAAARMLHRYGYYNNGVHRSQYGRWRGMSYEELNKLEEFKEMKKNWK